MAKQTSNEDILKKAEKLLGEQFNKENWEYGLKENPDVYKKIILDLEKKTGGK